MQNWQQFENAVADLYRLLGAKVTQNIEICQKKVDIFAEFPIQGSKTKHRVIVECKDEARVISANSRVMQFYGLLNMARGVGLADSAEIVTRVPWGDEAKGFALTSGISLLTYSEKVAQLIDFKPYLEELIRSFEQGDPARPSEPPLSGYYIDLWADDPSLVETPLINDYVKRWLLNERSLQNLEQVNNLAVLGEYGSGKSSFCLKVAHDLARNYVEAAPEARIPILLNLRDFVGTIKMEAFISSFLDQQCRVGNPRFELFKSMNEFGLFLLIFDGLDEMAVKIDSDTLELNLLEIDKLASPSKAKVLITSRPEHFINAEEEQKFLQPHGMLMPLRETQYDLVRILPWNEYQVREFLRRRVPLIKEATQPWTYYSDQISTIKGLSDLSQRPVLLDMIVKTLPKLLERNDEINLPNLYKTYLLEEIRRQKILKRRTLLLSEDDRLLLLRRLAGDIYSDRLRSIDFSDARNVINAHLNPPAYETEAYTREFLTNSFLIRRGNSYHFSHKSILEYLVAARIEEQLEQNSPDLLRAVLLQPVIVEFLVAMKPDAAKLHEWIEWTQKPNHSGAKYLGGNCATLLCALSQNALQGMNLSKANLIGANLVGIDLQDIFFQDAVMEEADLRFAKFEKEGLSSCKLGDSLFSAYFITDKPTTKVNRFRDYPVHVLGECNGRHLMSCLFKVKKFQDIERISGELSKELETMIAVFHHEYLELLNEYGGKDPRTSN